jgi:predicted nicotinamide N-methyase
MSTTINETSSYIHPNIQITPTHTYSTITIKKEISTKNNNIFTTLLQKKLDTVKSLDTLPKRWERETGIQIGGSFSEGCFSLQLNEHKITVSESAEEIGTRVWDSAILMSKWFEKMQHETNFLSGKRVIELGSGTGLLGLICAKLGASLVVLTDLPVLLQTMQQNIERNQLQQQCVARALNWNDAQGVESLLKEFGTFDYVVASDVLVFAGDARKPFLHTTVVATTEKQQQPVGLLYTIRAFADPKHTLILMGCGLNRQGFIDGFYNNPPTDLFDIQLVGEDEMHPDFRTKRIVLYRMKAL